jgi:hypothetical protein
LPAVKSVQTKEHIVEGDFVATVFEMETIFGVDQVFDRVHVCDGELKEIHSFYYPQPNQPRELLEAELRPSRASCCVVVKAISLRTSERQPPGPMSAMAIFRQLTVAFEWPTNL